MAASLLGCAKSENAQKEEIAKINRVFDSGNVKTLKVHLSPYGNGVGPIVLFHDNDGDGKTVEEYVRMYNTAGGLPMPSGIRAHLVRPGVASIYSNGSELNAPSVMRYMSGEEMQRLDTEYQRLLQLYEIER